MQKGEQYEAVLDETGRGCDGSRAAGTCRGVLVVRLIGLLNRIVGLVGELGVRERGLVERGLV